MNKYKYKNLQQCLNEVKSENQLQIYGTPIPYESNHQQLLFKDTSDILLSALSDYWLELPCYIEQPNKLHLSFYITYEV